MYSISLKKCILYFHLVTVSTVEIFTGIDQTLIIFNFETFPKSAGEGVKLFGVIIKLKAI